MQDLGGSCPAMRGESRGLWRCLGSRGRVSAAYDGGLSSRLRDMFLCDIADLQVCYAKSLCHTKISYYDRLTLFMLVTQN